MGANLGRESLQCKSTLVKVKAIDERLGHRSLRLWCSSEKVSAQWAPLVQRLLRREFRIGRKLPCSGTHAVLGLSRELLRESLALIWTLGQTLKALQLEAVAHYVPPGSFSLEGRSKWHTFMSATSPVQVIVIHTAFFLFSNKVDYFKMPNIICAILRKCHMDYLIFQLLGK